MNLMMSGNVFIFQLEFLFNFLTLPLVNAFIAIIKSQK